jgi:molecular chaperone HscA
MTSLDNESAKLILQSLIERLAADSESLTPQFGALISQTDRAALQHLLGTSTLSPKAAGDNTAGADSTTLVEDVLTQGIPAGSPQSAIVLSPSAYADLNLSCLKATGVQHEFAVSIDFGTAKSKAFAGRRGSDQPVQSDLKELAIGDIDGDLDRSIYSVASSVWISDDGLMFAGSHAMRRSSEFGISETRQRIDSIKQELSLASQEHELELPLSKAKNPTDTALKVEDAICYFLAYLLDLVSTDLQDRYGLSRYTPRRFTVPAWQEEQRKWATKKITRYLKRAQILSDSFRGRWGEGIPIAEVKWAIAEATKLEQDLDHLIDPVMQQFDLGISEPIAAGSARLWTDSARRGLVLIVDAGAGTTDFALFLVQQGPQGSKAFPLRESKALKMAGDQLDDILLSYILSKRTGHSDDLTRSKIANNLRLKSLRYYKRVLFDDGEVEIELATNEKVRITVPEFLEFDGVKRFASTVEDCLAEFLSTIDPTFMEYAEGVPGPSVIFTGGSATVPIFTKLAGKPFQCAGTTARFRESAQHLPEIITHFGDAFQKEYPMLAVAIGGTLPLIEEKSRPVGEWGVGAPPSGSLSRVQITGV